MKLRPTGHRIMIRPDEQPEADGNILLPQHRDYVATSGEVVAIGPRGSKVRWDARQRAMRDAIQALNAKGCPMRWIGEITNLIGRPDPGHDIKVGDRVAFDSESGLRLTENGVEYLIMNEDDVVVIVEESEAVA